MGVINGEPNIYVLSADGGEPRQVTDIIGMLNIPTVDWSPDGQRLLFVDEGETGIYVINFDGTGLTQLTSGHDDRVPQWSPDGSKIAFRRHQKGSVDPETNGFILRWDICVVKRDGSGLKQISGGGLDLSSPVWSPDGKYVAFERDTGYSKAHTISGSSAQRGATSASSHPGLSSETRSLARHGGTASNDSWRVSRPCGPSGLT